MKKIIYSFILLFVSFRVICQNTTLTWGPELPKPKRSDIATMIGSDQNSFYSLRVTSSLFSSQISLEKYSRSKMMLQYAKEFKMPEIKGRHLELERVFLLKGNLVVFASAYNSEQDRNIAYVKKINAETGSMTGTFEEIDYIEASKRRNSGSFEFVLSKDSSKILIAHSDPYEKYSNEKFFYKLIDEDMQTLWTAAIELPYRDKYFSISNYIVDGDGKVFMLASIKKEKSEREKRKSDYRYELVTYVHQDNRLRETEIILGDKFISDVSFALTAKGSIAVGGFYSNKNEDGLAGTFFMSLDKETYHVLSKGEKDFSVEFLTGFMSERRAEKGRELYNYKINYIVTKSDGGIYMVAEQYYMVVVTTSSPRGGSSTTYHYYYNDIIVININPDASIQWVKKIPKFQHTINDQGYYSSYSFFTSKDKLCFIYNDHPKNLLPDQKKTQNGVSKRMVTVMATMDVQGTLTRTSLFAGREEKTYVRPKIALQMGSDKYLFYASKKRNYKFCTLNY